MILKLPETCFVVFIDDTGTDDMSQDFFGLGGCAVMASQLDIILREPWMDVREVVAGKRDAQLHATDINPTPEQLAAIDAFFRQPFARFGAICSIKTSLDEDMSPLFKVAQVLRNRLIEICRWQPFDSVEIVFEHSKRLAPEIEKVFGDFNLVENGNPIPLGFSWMSKKIGEPGLEVADFLANSIGTEVRHRINKRPGHAKNFEAFFHHPDKRLVSFMDIH